MIFIEQDDVDGKLVGTEIEIEFNADKTVKGYKATGKSVVGELTITKEGDKDATIGEWKKGPGMPFLSVLKNWFPQIEFIAEDLG